MSSGVCPWRAKSVPACGRLVQVWVQGHISPFMLSRSCSVRQRVVHPMLGIPVCELISSIFVLGQSFLFDMILVSLLGLLYQYKVDSRSKCFRRCCLIPFQAILSCEHLLGSFQDQVALGTSLYPAVRRAWYWEYLLWVHEILAQLFAEKKT